MSGGYDALAAFDSLQSGWVLQEGMLDAIAAAYVANNSQPLTQAQIAAAVLSAAQAIEAAPFNPPIPPKADPYPDALPPVFPTLLPRFPDSNEEPFDGWVQFGPWLQGAEYD